MRPIQEIPTDPGCYQMLDERGKVIYVGKAKNLRKRVSSYFQKSHADSPKTDELVKKIHDIDFIATGTEVEALILEANLIRKYQPYYNIDLKENIRYAYIKVTDERFPRIVSTRRKGEKGRYFGPYTSGYTRMMLIRALNALLLIRTCKTMPKSGGPCLRAQMHLCCAPCTQKVTSEEYSDKISEAIEFLNGKTHRLIGRLEQEMHDASGRLEFERAAALRDQIEIMQSVQERQNFEARRGFDQDVLNYTEQGGKRYIVIFKVDKGTVINKRQFIVDALEDPMGAFIKQFYQNHRIPEEIIVPDADAIEEIEGLEEYLCELKGLNLMSESRPKVRIVSPKSGQRKELLDIVKRNVETNFGTGMKALNELKERLMLPRVPKTIECFDISHIGGEHTVGSMVHFHEGIADKSNYRRFKIKELTEDKADDFACMREVLHRRYSRLKREGKAMPDLIIVDGGAGQLTQAREVLKELGLLIPTVGLAKGLEEIYVSTKLAIPTVRLDEKSDALHLMRRIRDEAHRFAITYNRLLRSKSLA